MFSRRLLWSFGALITTVACHAAEPKLDPDRLTPVPADQPIPIQDFFRPPLWREPKLNPSGTHIAGTVEADGDKYQLLIYELKTQVSHAIAGAEGQDIQQFAWLDDHRLVFALTGEKLYALGLFAVDVDDTQHPYPLLQYWGATLVGVPKKDRLSPLVWLRHERLGDGNDFRDGGVAVINTGIKTGRFVNLLSAEASYSDLVSSRENNLKHIVERYPLPEKGIGYHYLANRQGQLAFAFTSDNGAPTLYRLTPQRDWQACPVDLEKNEIVSAGDKPDEVVAVVPGEPNKPGVLRYLNAATGEPSDVIVADKEYDFRGWLYHEPASQQIVGAMYERDGPRTVWFDDGFRAVQKAVDALFPGQIVRLIGNSEKGGIILIATFSDRHPVAYHWVDLEKRSAGLIKSTMPWIDPDRMRPMQIMKYTTSDGRLLDAYVTLPKGTSRKNPVPLIVLPHGGPWVRDTWGFNGEVQFLASRGYAVLQPNYRGSPGYDWMFPFEDKWDFLKMHDDVTAATRKLLATGAIDSTRVAIMGGSFGAYLALSGVTREPSLYRCAVTIAGVFDWAEVLQDRKYDQFTDPSYARLLRRLGDPKQQAGKFAAISPLWHVDQVRVPVFVAHGKEDPVAAVEQSRRLISELEKHHVPHEQLFVSREGHGMGHLKNRVELYSQIEAFLARNLAPLPAPSGPAGR